MKEKSKTILFILGLFLAAIGVAFNINLLMFIGGILLTIVITVKLLGE